MVAAGLCFAAPALHFQFASPWNFGTEGVDSCTAKPKLACFPLDGAHWSQGRSGCLREGKTALSSFLLVTHFSHLSMGLFSTLALGHRQFDLQALCSTEPSTGILFSLQWLDPGLLWSLCLCAVIPQSCLLCPLLPTL